MLNQGKIFLAICLGMMGFIVQESYASSPQNKAGSYETTGKPAVKGDDPELVEAVEQALQAIQKEVPLIHEQALKIWRMQDDNLKPFFVHPTYYYWGHRLIAWLKENKNIVFNSEGEIGEVFQILQHKGLISENAALVLTMSCWSHLLRTEGDPGLKKRLKKPEGEPIYPFSNKLVPYEQSI